MRLKEMRFKDTNQELKNIERIDLNRDMPIPLYYQISQMIRQEISSGELKPGDKILTEEKLQTQFDVSRATVRKAISDLVYDGLLEKRASKGTIVATPKVEETMYGVVSFTASTLQNNKSLRTEIIDFKVISNIFEIAEKLEIPESETVYYIKRIRYIDGHPVTIEDWYSPTKFLPGFSADLFTSEGEGQSSYSLIQKKYKFNLVSIHDIMSAVLLDPEESKLLDCRKGTPALLRQRVTYDENRVPIVYSSGRYLIKISLDFYADQKEKDR
jgi:GntR family transcriptional regulator